MSLADWLDGRRKQPTPSSKSNNNTNKSNNNGDRGKNGRSNGSRISSSRQQQQSQPQQNQRSNQSSSTRLKRGLGNGSSSKPTSSASSNTKAAAQPASPPKPRGIDQLREAFQQSLEIDRQRRQKKTNNDTSNETRLDQLLRRSRDGTMNGGGGSTNNSTGGGGSSSGGAKAFRERRKLAERMHNTNKMHAPQSQQQQSQQQPYQRNNNQNNGGGGRRNQDRYNRNNNNNYQRPPVISTQTGVDTTADPNALRNEMLRANDLAVHTRTSNSSSNSKPDTNVLLPNRGITIRELSSLLRIPKSKLAQTVYNLGGGSARSNRGKKLDIDMAELVSLELGFDPKRRAVGSKMTMEMEEAERRVLRGTSMEEEDGEEEDVSEADESEYYQNLPPRPPVVCIMGHVDHGKTTLMDSLRRKAAELAGGAGGGVKKQKAAKKSKKKGGKGSSSGKKQQNSNDELTQNVAGTEAGGITQVISAFQVQLPSSSSGETTVGDDAAISAVTFLDTPGHAAFKAMRQSGSNGADVIVLVVAADDGVSPQTVEIIDMYKTIARSQPGSISLVVAMTKIDKVVGNDGTVDENDGVVAERMTMIENQLMEHGIYTEGVVASSVGGDGGEFGGVQMIPVSGITGAGLDDLMEGLALQSEVMDLRADVEARAEGLVIDAKIEKGVGVVVDCIVRWGTLETGDYVLSGVSGGKLRILNNVDNKQIKKAGPSDPVRIIGLKTLPQAGDPIVCVQSEEIAKQIIQRREDLISASGTQESFRADASDAELDFQITGVASKHGSMTQGLLKKYGFSGNSRIEGENDENAEIRIPILLKADADGTLAALRDSVLSISEESKLNLCIDPIALGIGHVTMSDVRLARDSGATILCFNLKGAKDSTAMNLAAAEDVKIRSHKVIYHLLDEAKDAFSTYFPPVETELPHGNGIVKAVYDVNNKKDAEKIAGLTVVDGSLYLDKSNKDSGNLVCEYRVKRDGKAISPVGLRAKSLRRVKDEVDDVHRGDECGLNLLDYTDLEEGDIIECFSKEMKNMFV